MGLELKRRRSGWKRTQHCRQLHRSTDSGYGYVYTRGKSMCYACVCGGCVCVCVYILGRKLWLFTGQCIPIELKQTCLILVISFLWNYSFFCGNQAELIIGPYLCDSVINIGNLTITFVS